LIVLAQALVTSVAQGHKVNITNVHKTGPTSLSATYVLTTSDSVWGQVLELSTTPTFAIVMSSTPLAYLGHALGATFTTTAATPGGIIWYARIITHDSVGTLDTSSSKIMLDTVTVAASLDSTFDGFTTAYTYYSGNDTGAKLHVDVQWAPSYTSTWAIDSVVTATGMPIGLSITRHDTITSLVLGTHYRVRYTIKNSLGFDTIYRYGGILPPLMPPTIISSGLPVTTSTSVQLHLIGNVFGSTGGNSLVVYYRHTPTGPIFDSINFTPTSGGGPQDFYPLLSGLTPVDTVYISAKIRNSLGIAFMAPVMAVTQAAFSLNMTGVMTIHYDTLRATVHFSNITTPISVANVTVMLAKGTPDNIINTFPYPVLSGSGTVTPHFQITDTGIYYMYVSGVDSPGYTIVNGIDTLSLTVENCSIDTFDATTDTIVDGSRDTLYWNVSNASKVSIAGIGTVAASGSFITPLLHTTTTYTMTARGLNTTTHTKTVVVIPNTVGVKEFNGAAQIEVPGTLVVYDMLGRIVLRKEVSNAERVDTKTLPPGSYVMQLFANDGRVFAAKRIPIR
jgi:hypothetical protein